MNEDYFYPYQYIFYSAKNLGSLHPLDAQKGDPCQIGLTKNCCSDLISNQAVFQASSVDVFLVQTSSMSVLFQARYTLRLPILLPNM